jgi:hypothetical protein
MRNEHHQHIISNWKEAWPKAQKVWSDYVRLREPEWCVNKEQAALAGISDSFAMIRLVDHRIVIDINKLNEMQLEDDALQILAHEIGHHIYTPANLKDNAQVLAQARWSLIGIETHAPLVANLYEDLLINDRLHRFKGLDMAIIYKKINKKIQFSKLWSLYMRTYEFLWKLKRYELASQAQFHSDALDADAAILASLIRSYSKNWIDGTSRFAAMLYPYLMEEEEAKKAHKSTLLLLDAYEAGKGGGVVGGMTTFDELMSKGIIDPRGEALNQNGEDKIIPVMLNQRDRNGGVGPEKHFLNPATYIDLLQQVNPNINRQELINNYYKEISLPYLIDFPKEDQNNYSNTLPEGLENWDIGDSADEIDWVETAIYAPQIFPGINTLKRTYGPSNDDEKSIMPLDVYIGIDCSGSMTNPSQNFSWPIMAATIIALSALRAGAKVMGCLSGEPGKYLQNKGFETNETEILSVLTSYLGTGYAYGISRLKEPFDRKRDKKTHVIIVTDDDIYHMLNAKTDNGDNHWEIIEQTLENAGGSGTIVLHSHPKRNPEGAQRLRDIGWNIHYVTNESQLLTFAAEFSKNNY